MGILETRGGVPLVLRETFDLDGRKVNLFGNNKWICIRVKEFPCKVYFTEEDYDNDTNYIGINPPSEETPNGEWIGSTESNFIWIRGYNGNSEVELVAVKSLPDLYLGEYTSGSVLGLAAVITTNTVGTFSMTLHPVSIALEVDWGDGSAIEVVNPTGTDIVKNHTYSSSGHTISITGGIDANTKLLAANQSITNDLHSIIRYLTGVTILYLYGNQIVGNISTLSRLTNLITCYVYNNSTLAGDLSSISGLVNLQDLFLSNQSITGDIASIAPLTSLSYLGLYGNNLSFSSASFPPFTGSFFRLESCLSVQAHVDNLLIAFAAGGMHDIDLRLDGTNPSRTSLSDDAVVALVLAGVTLHLS